jgi:hypothetical protein
VAGCSGCGSVKGDSRMRIVQGETYRRSGLWTRKVDGVQVPLDANDWNAALVIRRNLTAPTAILELTSDPAAGITLVTEDDSVRFTIEIAASVTLGLPASKGFRYSFAFTDVGDPENVRVLVPKGYVDIIDTAL